MHPLKAPGPGGLPAFFFQKYWSIMGPNVMNLVLGVLNNGRDPSGLNLILLKALLPEIIDEEKSAFVKGKLIKDNALIAMECFHWMKKKKKGKKGMMALKLDMSKAYDMIE
ncbi:unnamed protein product [Vicia faba]|uniref:Reverse transcriptase n=1 Tax=Vicia faba TaxID=3906 RepID=A0AAV1B577_VICFA|nr:unnamed protein product [Vicia faba]